MKNKKTLALILSLVLVIGIAAGATVAWFTDTTDEVVNTFTVGNIDIDLDETTGEEYKMIPGWTITKDPYATVTADSEDCYLFVEVTEDIGEFSYTPSGTQTPVKATFDAFLSYGIADAWTALPGYPGVYYKVIDSAEEKGDANKHYVLKDNKVTTNATVTKEMMDALEEAGEDAYPTLSFKAYACQLYSTNDTLFGEVDAWKTVKGIS